MLNKLKRYSRLSQAVLVVGAVVVMGYAITRAHAAGVVGDINGDGVVNVFDLSIMLSGWNTTTAAADLNHDGIVSILDLSTLLSHWGQTSTPTPTATPTPTGTPAGFNTCTNPSHVIPSSLSDPQSGISLGGYYVDNDSWNFSKYPTSQQTLYVCDYNNWYAMVNVNDNANNGEVKTYPSIHDDFSEVSLSSLGTITSSFAETAPASGAWDEAYDIWINNYGVELMIWNQSAGRQAHVPGIPIVATVTLSGITYNIHKSGTYIAYDMPTTRTSGTLNLKEIMNDMISRGYISGSSTLSSIQYGVEVCDVGGVSTKFEFNNFSVTAQ